MAFTTLEGEVANSEGQVEALKWTMDTVQMMLKQIDVACTEWVEEVEQL